MKYTVRQIVIGGLLLALGVILPSLFHMVGISGTIFSPMHIPVLLAGFILGPVLGLFIGILTPLLNFLVTGGTMPPIPILWVMMAELGVYALAAGLLYKKLKVNVLISLVASMILGRLMGALTVFALAQLFSFQINPIFFLKAATITAFPGIVIQLILVPALVVAYQRAYGRKDGPYLKY